MKKFLIAVVLLIPSFLVGQEEIVLFEQGNQLYRNAEFQKAVEVFEQIVKNGYESSSLYYNLGNAYFKLQNIPSAILSYERAKRLTPHDDDILYNLRLANLRVIDKIEPIPQLFIIEWWNGFVDLFSSAMWAVIGIAGLWIAVCSGAMFVLARAALVQRISLMTAAIAVICCVVAFTSMVQRVQAEQHSQHAIVFSQSVAVRSAPDVQSTELFVLHEGVKLEVLDAVGEWRKIRLADGKIGWLTLTVMQLI